MIFEKVREMLAEKLECEEETILPETKFLDIGIDSLDVTEMVMNLEDEFGVEIGMDASIVTVADLVAKIERKLEEKNTAQSS
ncbi:MAG: acyl carrier protein [Eubacteriales bacterium]|jgi:acyl carrier protein|nr:acyl carrier protein [Clostridiales bacterium]